MEGHVTPPSNPATLSSVAIGCDRAPPFSVQQITITKQEYIELRHQASYWKSQHAQAKERIKALEEEIDFKEAKIKDLTQRLFGKKSEKNPSKGSEKGESKPAPKRKRGQQPGCRGHGRTQRPDLPVVHEVADLQEAHKYCAHCGLPYLPNESLDEQSTLHEVQVRAYVRRVRRKSYTRHSGCTCEGSPAIKTAAVPPKVIPGGGYAVSFWVEILLGKYLYGQPTHRGLQNLRDLGMPVSAGTVTDGLKRLAVLFEPLLDALYRRQMGERLFHNDETRWEVFEPIEGKVGSRWYLWVTRSQSVIFYRMDPSRSAAVPGAHFAGITAERIIIVCDRYSAYKKLAREGDGIWLAFCWAHVRRDFLEAARAFAPLEDWGVHWKERIGELYHHNKLRLAHWNPQRPLGQQSEAFMQAHHRLEHKLQALHEEASTVVHGQSDDTEGQPVNPLPKSARTKQKKILNSLLAHWPGLTLFVDHPEVPMDNNHAEQAIRGPVSGRKNYYGSGSCWSATLAAMMFSILQSLGLWHINPRHWLSSYLQACAERGGQAPQDLSAFLPWSMDESRRRQLSAPTPPPELPPVQDSS